MLIKKEIAELKKLNDFTDWWKCPSISIRRFSTVFKRNGFEHISLKKASHKGLYMTALKFKTVLDLVQNGRQWIKPLHSEGFWIFCKEEINPMDAIDMVKASKEEAHAIAWLFMAYRLDWSGNCMPINGEPEWSPVPMPRTIDVIQMLKKAPKSRNKILNMMRNYNLAEMEAANCYDDYYDDVDGEEDQ